MTGPDVHLALVEPGMRESPFQRVCGRTRAQNSLKILTLTAPS